MKSIVLIALSVITLHATAQTQNISSMKRSNSKQTVLAVNNSYTFLKNESVNSRYLNSVIESSSSAISELENVAANFNITTIDEYEANEPSEYQVTFKNEQGHLYVTYNHDGQIIKSIERFKNIAIPSFLRVHLAKTYPNWSIGNNICTKQYSILKGVKTIYKIEIQNGNTSKTISISNEGVLL